MDDGILITKLRSGVKGRVIAPGDEEYEKARTVFYGWVNRRPRAVVRVADENDVARIVLLARDAGLELAVRSGGHSLAGHGTSEGGIVLDLSDMRALEINAAKRTAWAQTGLTAAEYTAQADVNGLATGFGDTGSVGIGGLTLGGGIGYLVRKHGLTIDSLLAADVVTADGQVVRTDNATHPDLFWAIRGGGGNFGVATRFQFRLHEVGQIMGGMLILPATAEVIASLVAEAEAAPDEVSIIANIMVAPPMPFLPKEAHGKLVVLAMMVYAGPVELGERAIAPFRKLTTPLSDMVKPIRYPEIYKLVEDGPRPVGESVRSVFRDTVDRGTAQMILDRLRASTAPLAVAQIRVLGGAMGRVPVEATAFSHRTRRILAAVGAVYDHVEEVEVHEAWVTDFLEALRQGDAGTYVNFLGRDGEARINEAYPGPTRERLRTIKNRYDPTNLFRLNQNIAPAGRRGTN
jgi:FAD/FMN-containing dehydrogenase